MRCSVFLPVSYNVFTLSRLTGLVREHASDASSSNVRAGAVNAITIMIEAPQSHTALRPLLPLIGNLIHDRNEKVRLAVASMLVRLKNISGIKYYHVVPMEHLTSRLSDEGRLNIRGPVASKLTALMINSYFPQGENISATKQIQRTCDLLAKDPTTAKVFYANISEHLKVDQVVKLICILHNCLYSAVEAEQLSQNGAGLKRSRNKKQKASSSDHDNETHTKSVISANETRVMAALVDTISVLWESIESKLKTKAGREHNEHLIKQFSGSTLLVALAHFEQRALLCDDDPSEQEDCYRTCASILRCAGRLPSKAIEGLVTHISQSLASLRDSTNASGNVSAFIALLCLWDMTEEVATSLATSIVSSFESDYALKYEHLASDSLNDSRKRRSGRRATASNQLVAVPMLPALVALDVLSDVLRGSDPSSAAARECILDSPIATQAIDAALERGIKYAERILNGDEVNTESATFYLASLPCFSLCFTVLYRLEL
jgi:condensin-2 complex subunit G2